MTTRYAAGRESEYKAQRELAAAGYSTLRTAGSHGPIDVHAWSDTEARYIQIKTFQTKPGSYAQDIAELEAMPLPPNASAELWIRKRGQTGWLHKHLIRRNV